MINLSFSTPKNTDPVFHDTTLEVSCNAERKSPDVCFRRLLPHWDAFVLMWLHYGCILLYIIRSRTDSIKRSDRQRGKRLEQTLPICVGETPGADKTLRHKQAHKHQVWEKTYTFYTRVACENTLNRFISPVISWKTGCFFLLLIRFFQQGCFQFIKWHITKYSTHQRILK